MLTNHVRDDFSPLLLVLLILNPCELRVMGMASIITKTLLRISKWSSRSLIWFLFPLLVGCAWREKAELFHSSSLQLRPQSQGRTIVDDRLEIVNGANAVLRLIKWEASLFPMHGDEQMMAVEVPSVLLVRGSTIRVPSQGAATYSCKFVHPYLRCTEHVSGHITILDTSPNLRVGISLHAIDAEKQIQWSLEQNTTFRMGVQE